MSPGSSFSKLQRIQRDLLIRIVQKGENHVLQDIYCLTLIHGKRFAGIDHLKKLAKIVSDKYGITGEVLANGTGKAYEHHLVSRYESLAQLEEVEDKFLADEDYLAWFGESEGLVEWQHATSNLYRVFD